MIGSRLTFTPLNLRGLARGLLIAATLALLAGCAGTTGGAVRVEYGNEKYGNAAVEFQLPVSKSLKK